MSPAAVGADDGLIDASIGKDFDKTNAFNRARTVNRWLAEHDRRSYTAAYEQAYREECAAMRSRGAL